MTCWRETWSRSGNGRCIWHADVVCKLADDLADARINTWERIDGAYLRETGLDNAVSFADCVLHDADLTDARLWEADLSDVTLRGATLSGAGLQHATLCGADLRYADLSEASLGEADLSEADLSTADLSAANLVEADLSAADLLVANLNAATLMDADLSATGLKSADLNAAALIGADLSAAALMNADLSAADLRDADLSVADLREADLTDADLRGANLTNADLRDTDFTDATAREIQFDSATLENALLTRTDLREARLDGAALYQARFSDTRISSQTDFGNVCSYKADDEPPTTAENVPPLEAATWVYRRLEKLHEENALADRTRQLHIRKEEAQRKLDRRQGNWGRYAVATLNRYLTNHGESLKRLLVAWAVPILGAGLLYPFVGGVEDGGTLYQIQPVLELPTLAGIAGALDALLRGIYFSIITFTTIGYANVAPHGPGSRVLVGIESLVGAILIALFVYVLGRRVAR